MAREKKQFERISIHTVDETDFKWIGVERWKITGEDGTSETSPTIAKREKNKTDREGVKTYGKCKGFTLREMSVIVEKWDELKGIMEKEDPRLKQSRA